MAMEPFSLCTNQGIPASSSWEVTIANTVASVTSPSGTNSNSSGASSPGGASTSSTPQSSHTEAPSSYSKPHSGQNKRHLLHFRPPSPAPIQNVSGFSP